VIAALLMEVTPGPNMGWLALLSAREGRRAGNAAVIGIALGLTVVAALAIFGLGLARARIPGLFGALQTAGVLYMLWLAWEALRDDGESSPVRSSAIRRRPPFVDGLVLNLLNPKALSFFATVVPTFVVPARSTTPQLVVLATVYVSIATAVHLGIVALAARLRMALEGRHTRTFGRVSGVMLALVALWIAFA
jgi:threonine/homoserine/homoserine lactone efflux protein